MTSQIKTIQEKSVPILKRAGVIRSSIFGSYARNEMINSSDIDILIEFKGEKSLFDLADLKNQLEKALEREVDILTYQSLHPRLQSKIEQVQIL